MSKRVTAVVRVLAAIPLRHPRVTVARREYDRGLVNVREWWARQDLNLRPDDYESSALTN